VRTEKQLRLMRQQMVDKQLAQRGIHDMRVLDAMRRVPRHAFIPYKLHAAAYDDSPLPIGEEQTISQPFIVAMMTQLLELKGDERVLEIGTGCGYQTAILCELAREVYSLERFSRLADRAARALALLGYDNLDIHVGDGSQGLPDMAPFDAIIVTAAAPTIPGPLSSQLAPDGGRMVLPVGDRKGQRLQIVYRHGSRCVVQPSIPVRFVPLVGRYGFHEAEVEDSPADDDQSPDRDYPQGGDYPADDPDSAD
jgi:protein-L-isoaspartate(D-aspartate) O-methyltransferase